MNEAAINVGDTRFPCLVHKGSAELPELSEMTNISAAPDLPAIGRRAILPGAMPTDLTPDAWTPSELASQPESADLSALHVEQYGEGLDVDLGLSATSLGTYLHRCFEVLGARPQRVDRLALLTGVEAESDVVQQIAAAVATFEEWLGKHYTVESVLREWPLLMLDERGSVVSGTADLLVQTPEGVWVIDHKSDQTEDPRRAFLGYQAQLESYALALQREGRTVLGTAIPRSYEPLAGVHATVRGEG